MKIKKAIGIALIIFAVAISFWASYIYSVSFGSSWDLADRASSIEQKQVMIHQFYTQLESASLSEYNALIFKTPENNCGNNMIALSSLDKRLGEIRNLDPEGFAYQTAMQQITEQEQGQADALTSTLKGCWTLKHYLLAWDWINATIFTLGLLMLLGSILKHTKNLLS